MGRGGRKKKKEETDSESGKSAASGASKVKKKKKKKKKSKERRGSLNSVEGDVHQRGSKGGIDDLLGESKDVDSQGSGATDIDLDLEDFGVEAVEADGFIQQGETSLNVMESARACTIQVSRYRRRLQLCCLLKFGCYYTGCIQYLLLNSRIF